MPGGIEADEFLPGRPHEIDEPLVAVQNRAVGGKPDHAQGGFLENDAVAPFALLQFLCGLGSFDDAPEPFGQGVENRLFFRKENLSVGHR